MATPLSLTPRAWLLLVSLSFLWGLSFLLYDIALDGFGPLAVVLGRTSISALTLLIILRALRQRLPTSLGAWGQLAVLGVLNNALPFLLIATGMVQPGFHGGMASIFNATVPLFTVFIAHFFLVDERLKPAKLLGILTGIAGVAVMMARDAWTGETGLLMGGSLVLGATLSYGAAGVWARRTNRLEPLQVATGQQVAATFWVVLPVALIDRPWSYSASVGLDSWLALIALGVLSTGLAYILFFQILRMAGATNVSLVTLLIPIWAILFNATIRENTLAFWQTITLAQWVGIALIFLGLAIVNGWLPRRKTGP